MKKGLLYFFVNCFLQFVTIATIAQPGFYIPQSGKIYFVGDTSTIFSNVLNQGTLGLDKNAVVNFSGKTWENSEEAKISDESSNGDGVNGVGGWVQFISDSVRQQILGGYNAAARTGPSFPRLRIQNTQGVELLRSSLKTRREIRFGKGLVFLLGQTFVLGQNDPGRITGYDSSAYFVTGNKALEGFLVRENIQMADGRIDFPVGSREHAYTPAAIRNTSNTGDDFYVSVHDSVSRGQFNPQDILDQGVGKTWTVGKFFRPGFDEVELHLQHLNADEGSRFASNRINAYIARLDGPGWDLAYPQNAPLAGYINSTGILTNSGVNNRVLTNFIGSGTYFTKLTGNGNAAVKTDLRLYGYRIDQTDVSVYWKVKPESNVRYYIVQRKLSTESNFTNRDTILSHINGGISMTELNYVTLDKNQDKGISYYRLLRVDFGNTSGYSNMIAVGPESGKYVNLLWPNPAPGKFYLALSPLANVRTIVIWNAIGQQIKVEKVNGRSILEFSGFVQGAYFVSLIGPWGNVVETKPIIVAM